MINKCEPTHLDWSQSKLTNRLASSFLLISSEQAQETVMKHSAHAFLTPHTPSSHKKKNLGSCPEIKILMLFNVLYFDKM